MTLDTWAQIAFGVMGVVWLLIQLKIQNSIQAAILIIREHMAADEEKHKAIDAHFDYTDKRVDRLDRLSDRKGA